MSFMFHNCARFSLCSRVTQQVREVRATLVGNNLADSPVYSFGLGDLLREWNELEAAQQHLARGMDLLEGLLSIVAEQLWLGKNHPAITPFGYCLVLAGQLHCSEIPA